MADADWQAFAAPTRRSLLAVREPAARLRRLGDDEPFWDRLRALNRLPDCASYHPFGVTARWQVELHTEEAARAEEARETSAFTARLTDRARRRQQFSLVTARAAPAERVAEAPQHVAEHFEIPRHLAENAGTPSPAGDAAPSGGANPQPAERAARAEQGAWVTLARIAELVDVIGADRAPGERSRPPEGVMPAAIAAPTQPAAAPARNARRHAVLTAPPTSERGASRALRAGAPADPAPRARLDLLADYTSVLLPGAGATVQGQAPASPPAISLTGAGPAPRAPSLLRPATGAGPEDSSVSAREMKTPEAQRASPASSLPDATTADEDLTARLNRALIEQAWLRGVDLT